ncbi:MAG: hypothetical protein M3O50_18270 [Myxococcota bacterium]|nr:hypothetical protein [Myxococcota bacterium]
MRKRSSGVVAVAFALLVAMAVTPLLLLGKGRVLLDAWGTLASRVSTSLSPSAVPSTSVAIEAGAPHSEAGAPAHRQAGPLSSAQLGAPLLHGPFVSACGAPDNMKVVVDVTVKMGRAVAVAVKTDPPNPVVASCIERAARGLQWDMSPKTDHVTVTY